MVKSAVRVVATSVSLIIVSLTWASEVLARAMNVMESHPAAQAVMDGSSTQFFVRFDGPVDHRKSSLVVERDGRVVESLHPRLESAPSVLYANGGRLEPGSGYSLHWIVRSLTDQEETQGTIPFVVR